MTDPEMMLLMRSEPFRKFLLRIVTSAGILIPASGATEDLLQREGRRSLGLEILNLAGRGLPRGSQSIEAALASILQDRPTPKETESDAGSDESRTHE